MRAFVRPSCSKALAIDTLIQTAKLNDIDPQTWLADVVGKLLDHSTRQIADLLPWNRKRRENISAAA